jgi:hypothetical protein
MQGTVEFGRDWRDIEPNIEPNIELGDSLQLRHFFAIASCENGADSKGARYSPISIQQCSTMLFAGGHGANRE